MLNLLPSKIKSITAGVTRPLNYDIKHKKSLLKHLKSPFHDFHLKHGENRIPTTYASTGDYYKKFAYYNPFHEIMWDIQKEKEKKSIDVRHVYLAGALLRGIPYRKVEEIVRKGNEPSPGKIVEFCRKILPSIPVTDEAMIRYTKLWLESTSPKLLSRYVHNLMMDTRMSI